MDEPLSEEMLREIDERRIRVANPRTPLTKDEAWGEIAKIVDRDVPALVSEVRRLRALFTEEDARIVEAEGQPFLRETPPEAFATPEYASEANGWAREHGERLLSIAARIRQVRDTGESDTREREVEITVYGDKARRYLQPDGSITERPFEPPADTGEQPTDGATE